MPSRLVEFQRNAAFVSLSVVVCFAATIFLARDLRGVIIPLSWAAFFALPICGCINAVEGALVAGFSACRRFLLGSRAGQHEDIKVSFSAATGQCFVTVARDWKTEEMLRRVNRPLGVSCRCCRRSRSSKIVGCCRRRVRIVELGVDGGSSMEESLTTSAISSSVEDSVLGPEVNRLVEGWHYYIKDSALPDYEGTPASGSHVSENARHLSRTVDLELFLDHTELYPAAVTTRNTLAQQVKLRGLLEVERPSTVSWTLSVLIVFAMCGALLGGGSALLGVGITALVDNIQAYQKGIEGFGKWVLESLKRILPESTVKEFEDKFAKFVQDAIPTAVSLLLSNVEIVMWDIVLFLIYLGFWISEPLPIDREVARVFRVYLFLKTLVCILFGSLMGILLSCLDCPLWPLFWVMTFLLNYIPEVGAVLSALLSVPAVLFDGNVDVRTRCWRTVWLAIFGTLFKVITGNVIEVHVYSTKGGQFMRMHPVVLMAMMMLCYALMGVSGMFLAVPIVATLKFYIVATKMPRAFLDPLLILIEGDVTGPHKNFVDTHKSRELEIRPRNMALAEDPDSLQLRLLDTA